MQPKLRTPNRSPQKKYICRSFGSEESLIAHPRSASVCLPDIREELSFAHNSKANVQVVCRFRPLTPYESQQSEDLCVTLPNDKRSVIMNGGESEQLMFSFDYVFPLDAPQSLVYNISSRPIIESVLEGFNGTVLTYGQTSSGKTFTMTGPDIYSNEMQGIIPRMATNVFDYIKNSPGHLEFTVKVSYLEIYMEKFRDLVKCEKTDLRLHENSTRGIYISDLTEIYVSCPAELMEIIRIGNRSREVGNTMLNQNSSRSHAILLLTVIQNNTLDFSAKSGTLYLVDLAGSEKVSKTGAEGKRLDEAKNINKSLSTLGLVIFSLTDGKSAHIPYRDSKLTRILQNSLGGNSKTCLIITCSPSVYNTNETISTLRFGVRAKCIKNKPKVNKELTVEELKQMLCRAENMVSQQNQKILLLEQQLSQTEIRPLDSKITSGSITNLSIESLQEIEEDRQKLAVANEKIEKLSHELTIQTIKNQNLIKENDTLNSKLYDIRIEMLGMRDFISDLQDENSTLKDSREYLEKEIEMLNGVHTKLSSRLEEAENENVTDTEYRLRLSELAESTDEGADTEHSKHSTLKDIENTEGHMQSELDFYRENYQRLKSQISSEPKPKRDNEENLQDMTRKLKSLERNLEQMTLMFKQSQEQICLLRSDYQLLDRKYVRKSERISILEKMLKTSREQAAIYKHKNLVMSSEVQDSPSSDASLSLGRFRKKVRGGNNNIPQNIESPYKMRVKESS
jgi:kinesin family protein 5